VLIFLGVFVPIQVGAEWAETPVMFFYWPFLTASMTSAIVADSIAGERERHTLDTLLATPLSDRAILLGKVVAAILYGYAFALTHVGLGLVTVVVRYGDQAARMSWPRFAWLLALIGAAAALVASLGLVVSARVATVRQAQQMFGVMFLALTALPAMLLALGGPDQQARVLEWISLQGIEGIARWASATMLLLALPLFIFGLVRFQRGTRVVTD
jgi:ABC-2 type transport system permease protein